MERLVIGLFLMLMMTACSGGNSATVEGEWELVSYNQTAPVPDVETSIEFKDGQMSGNVGCNGFGGEYTVKGDKIEFGSIMSTMMFCEALADQESSTLAAMQNEATFILNEDRLAITSSDGNNFIMLKRK